MECGKLTAKLMDAVPVCFIENGMEIKRLKNIEIPDEIKKLPFIAFRFDVPSNGAITFKIMFESSVLPAVFYRMSGLNLGSVETAGHRFGYLSLHRIKTKP